MNNMYKPNLIPVLALLLLISWVVACDENQTSEDNRRNKYNSVNFPHTPELVVPDPIETGIYSDTMVNTTLPK